MHALRFTYHPKSPPPDAAAEARWAMWPLAPTDDPRAAAALRLKEFDLDFALRPLNEWVRRHEPWTLPPEIIVRVEEAVHPQHVTGWEKLRGQAPRAAPTRRLVVEAPLSQEGYAVFYGWATRLGQTYKRHPDVGWELLDLPAEYFPAPAASPAAPEGAEAAVPPPAVLPSWTQTPPVTRRGG